MVLEARENAEKVWYPIIWEDAKEAGNVIDYDIHDEITIDKSSIFNANNNTTTGMANVIPWVNSPKLIEWTSIYNNVWGKTAFARMYWEMMLYVTGTKTGILNPQEIQSQDWAYKYKIWNYFDWYSRTPNSCLIIPAAWVYVVTCTYRCSEWNFNRSYDVYLNLDIVKHLQNDTYYSETWSVYPSETFYIWANAGDQLAIYYTIVYPSWQLIDRDVTTEIRKLS